MTLHRQAKQVNSLEVLHLIAERKRWRVLLHSEPVAGRSSRPCTLELVEQADRADVVARVELDGVSVGAAAEKIVEGLREARLIP